MRYPSSITTITTGGIGIIVASVISICDNAVPFLPLAVGCFSAFGMVGSFIAVASDGLGKNRCTEFHPFTRECIRAAVIVAVIGSVFLMIGLSTTIAVVLTQAVSASRDSIWLSGFSMLTGILLLTCSLLTGGLLGLLLDASRLIRRLRRPTRKSTTVDAVVVKME